MPGLDVCFEGIDAAGKCTQATLLSQALEKMRIPAKVYSYPDYNFDYGKIIDRYLNGHLTLSVDELFFLFLVDMVKDKASIKKELAEKKVVIMDRYFYSTIAYQCAGGFDYKRAIDFVRLLDLTPPSVVFYLDITPEMAVERKLKEKGSLDKHERDTVYLNQVREAYSKLVADLSDEVRWIRIDGSQSIEDVHKQVMSELLKLGEPSLVSV